MVDRRTELSQLRGVLAECASGGGATVLVTGGLASGKSTLLAAFADVAAEQGAVLLTATGTRLEQSVRMGVVWQLLGSAPLPAGVPERVAGLIDGDGDSDGVAAGVRAAHGLCGVLLGLAEDAPLVVVVDDLQFADDATLQVLTTLRRRARAARVMLVLGEWDRPGMARSLAVAELTRAATVEVRLGPLSEAAVARVAAGVLEPKAAALLTPALHALSGGSPALVHALVADCRELGPDADRPVPGTAFRRAVLDCLHRWDPDVLRVAGGLAVLGGHAGAE
ncbi:MAG: ATP-binding protein, partial [Actinophytocola sp.]|uniref:ATP-binding protein n=1 Tax=Actinophytocola sp. TaxID=1872138 RepID=UPI003C76C087